VDKSDKPIYFTKVLFEEVDHGYMWPKRVTLLNLAEKELSLQLIDHKYQMPAGIKAEVFSVGKTHYAMEHYVSAKIVRNARNNYEPLLLEDNIRTEEVIFSWAIKLTDKQMEELLPYCNALDFEPYRGRKMSMDDEGYIGYRDEIITSFTGITDSYIPLLELPMNYYYDEQHIWPSEKLYRYIIKTFYDGNKKLRYKAPCYGGGSLFF